jgi:hypothetical protein
MEGRRMESVNPEAFEYAISQIKDGNLFERFCQDILCQIIGVEFIPVGRLRDRAIDGLEHCSHIKTDGKTIYQISIETNTKTKIKSTILTLQKHHIKCDRLFYVTNQLVEDQDLLEEELYKEYKIVVSCRDRAWLRGNVNKNEGTVRTYQIFIESYYHEYSEPGKSHIIADFISDPRLYVFLRQQWEEYGHETRLDDLLVDSLVVFALEGTDPDKKVFMSRDEIFKRIADLVSFPPKSIEAKLDERLEALSKKPRRINHHRNVDKYCLPYETRFRLEEQNLADRALYEVFIREAERRLRQHLSAGDTQVKDVVYLLDATFNMIFKQQGLEFSDFLIKAENSDAVEKSLPDIISGVVDASSVIPLNRDAVKRALLSTIREIVYRGSYEEHEFLRRLAQSYMMLFLIQCDPKISTYFAVMASKLKVFVCTSILVPALSEYPLQKEHRRHWNLLVNAHNVGVELLINRVILQELLGHIRIALKLYEEEYRGSEAVYSDESAIPYIKEILVRSFFYSLVNGQRWSFKEFIDGFITPDGSPAAMEAEMIEWLQEQYGIKYVEDKALGVTVDRADLESLTKELSPHKGSEQQARNDAQTILTIYALREKNNEKGQGSIFGYRTWWLSMDTTTQQAIAKCFGDRYPISCYIRPDFLLNYISLAPTPGETDLVFNRMFPTLMGVTLSHHIPEEVSDCVHKAIREHKAKDPARVRAILKRLSDQLKTDQATVNRRHLEHYLDEQFKKV